MNLISNQRRRSGLRGSVVQREFLLSCLILSCSAATSTLTDMGTYCQSDKNATTDLTTSHRDDVSVAPIDALRAFSNETSKPGIHPNRITGEACEASFTRNSDRLLNLTQARQSINPEVPSPQIADGSINEEHFCSSLRCMGHGSFSLIDSRSTPQIDSKEKRPPYRYATLIEMAILRANDHCLSLAQIYQCISDNFPYYSLTDSKWKNIIKIKRPSHDPGKGHYWGLKPVRQCLFMHERTRHHSVTVMNNLQSTCDWIQRPYSGNEALVAQSTTHSIEELDLGDRTIDKHPQRRTRPSCMIVETREPNGEGDSLHVPVLQFPRTPSAFPQSRQEVQTLPLQWEVEMDCIGRTSSLEDDGCINSCNYALFDGEPVTHVYLPHVMRESGPERHRFGAHRAESEIARIRSSCIRKSRK